MRAFFATILLAAACLLVIWIIKPPEFRLPSSRHPERAVAAPPAGQTPRAAQALPQGALRLVETGEHWAVFLAADEVREGDAVIFTMLTAIPEPEDGAPSLKVWTWKADCAGGTVRFVDGGGYSAGGIFMEEPAAGPRRAMTVKRLAPVQREAVRVACGGAPAAITAEPVGAMTALAATPSLIAANKAMGH